MPWPAAARRRCLAPSRDQRARSCGGSAARLARRRSFERRLGASASAKRVAWLTLEDSPLHTQVVHAGSSAFRCRYALTRSASLAHFRGRPGTRDGSGASVAWRKPYVMSRSSAPRTHCVSPAALAPGCPGTLAPPPALALPRLCVRALRALAARSLAQNRQRPVREPQRIDRRFVNASTASRHPESTIAQRV